MIVGFYPNQEDELMMEPFTETNREGAYWRGIFKKVGLEYWYGTYLVKCASNLADADHIKVCKHWLWKEISELKPKLIIALGSDVARILFKLKKTAKLKDYAGRISYYEYLNCDGVTWYTGNYLLNQSKELTDRTETFFKEVRTRYHV